MQKIDHQKWEQLLHYITKNELSIDTNEFAKGDGTIILHNHLSSGENKQEQQELIGEAISLYDIVAQGTKITEMNSVQLKKLWIFRYFNFRISGFKIK